MYYFLLNPYIEPAKANYQHSCVVIAEGFKKLGIEFGANIDYYPDLEGNYLFKQTEFKDQELIITSAPEDFKQQIDEMVRLPHRRLIIIDTKDEWVRNKSVQMLPLAYKYFMSTSRLSNAKVRPWVFGYTQRMMDSVKSLKWEDREERIAVCHRVDNHQIRNMVVEHYNRKKIKYNIFNDRFDQQMGAEEWDTHWWRITGRRHSEAYFSYIGSHKYLDAHGGYLSGQNVVQWDSWKVWEGFLSGTLVITADLDYYRIHLPFPLKPWEHYIPIRYDQMEASYDKLFRLPDEQQQRIAEAGRQYVLEHYSPERLAEIINKNML